MKLALNLVLSIVVLGLCVYLVWPDAKTADEVKHALEHVSWIDLVPYIALLAVVQVCRSLRWNNLLAPLGVRVPAGPLLAISSVGFMAILALPARLGEFVRPGLLRKRGDVSAAAALGTVAVERIVDGLMISLFVFGALFARRGPDAPGWMMPTAYSALAVFSAALVFLLFALRWPEQTVRYSVKLTLLPRFAPRIARAIESKLGDMVRGFIVLRDVKNMAIFILWSFGYWGANGLGMWLLAHAFHIELSMLGAFATMGIIGVGIMLPNSPGLVGQFVYFMLLGASLYLGFNPTEGKNLDPVSQKLYGDALAYATLHYLLQVTWYVLCGAIGLLTPWVSLHDLWTSRKVAPDPLVSDDTA